MRCGQRGCECTTCFDCDRLHENCICDLKARTKTFVEENAYLWSKHTSATDEQVDALELLKEWSQV